MNNASDFGMYIVQGFAMFLLFLVIVGFPLFAIILACCDKPKKFNTPREADRMSDPNLQKTLRKHLAEFNEAYEIEKQRRRDWIREWFGEVCQDSSEESAVRVEWQHQQEWEARNAAD